MIRKFKAVCGEGRPGKEVATTRNFSRNNKLSNPRFVPVTYSTSVSKPIKVTATAQIHVNLYARCEVFSLHNIHTEMLAKTKVVAVFGTICGWPGITLRSVERSIAHPVRTRQATPTPMALATVGTNRNLSA